MAVQIWIPLVLLITGQAVCGYKVPLDYESEPLDGRRYKRYTSEDCYLPPHMAEQNRQCIQEYLSNNMPKTTFSQPCACCISDNSLTYIMTLDECLDKTQNHRRAKRTIATDHLTWPLNIIPYQFVPAANSTQEAAFDAAIAIIEQQTLVTFEKLCPFAIVPPGGCPAEPINLVDVIIPSFAICRNNYPGMEMINSALGFPRNDGQDAHLSADCFLDKGILLSILASIAGAVDEDNRMDRDAHVTQDLTNVISFYQPYFDKELHSLNDDPWDCGSITHKAVSDFSSPASVVLTTVDPKFQRCIGQRDTPSFFDIKSLNMWYGTACPDPNPCMYGGYLFPDTNCDTCVCMEGLDPANNCGTVLDSGSCSPASPAPGVLTATDAWQTLDVGDTGDGSDCGWIIEPDTQGCPVEIELQMYDYDCKDTLSMAGFETCDHHWLEIRTDLAARGPRYCCQDLSAGEIYQSSTADDQIFIWHHTSSCVAAPAKSSFQLRYKRRPTSECACNLPTDPPCSTSAAWLDIPPPFNRADTQTKIGGSMSITSHDFDTVPDALDWCKSECVVVPNCVHLEIVFTNQPGSIDHVTKCNLFASTGPASPGPEGTADDEGQVEVFAATRYLCPSYDVRDTFSGCFILRYQNVDSADTPTSTINSVPDRDTCQSHCVSMGTDACNGFSYTPTTDVCVLYNHTDTSMRMLSVASGTHYYFFGECEKKSATHCGFKVTEALKADYGSYTTRISTTDYISCWHLCLGDDVCRAFAYAPGTSSCELHSEATAGDTTADSNYYFHEYICDCGQEPPCFTEYI